MYPLDYNSGSLFRRSFFMSNVLKLFWVRKMIILFITLFVGLLPFSIVYLIVNPTLMVYQIDFSLIEEREIDVSKTVEIANIELFLKNTSNDYTDVNINKLLEDNHFQLLFDENTEIYSLNLKGNCFSKKSLAKKFGVDFLEKQQEFKDNILFKQDSIIIETNTLNSNIFLAIGSCIGFLIALGVVYVVYLKNGKEIIEVEYDNKKIYRTPFHLSYWKNPFKCFNNVKDLTMLAILFSLLLMSQIIMLPSGFGNLGISLGFIFFCVIALLYGPTTAIVIGFLNDILGYFLFQGGVVFVFGYTFNAMLSGFLYGIFFYKTKISFFKVFICRSIINMFVNAFLGSIWWGVTNSWVFEQSMNYMVVFSIPKNLVYLIPQSIVMFLVFKSVCPLLSHMNMIEKEISNKIVLF